MANDYRLSIAVRGGAGTITINGVSPVEYYTEGASLTIAIVLDNGFSNVQWYSSPNNTLISSSTSFSYTMPSSDVKIYAIANGYSQPIDGYGLKYHGLYGTNYGGDCWDLKILKDGYSGAVNDLLINDITYSWGNKGDDPLTTIVGSSVDFTIAGDTGEFNEFLEGGNRSWNVILSTIDQSYNINSIYDWYLNTIPNSAYNSCIYQNGKFYAVSRDNGFITVSNDGLNWTKISTTSSGLFDIIYANNKFVAVGFKLLSGNYDTSVQVSTDGLTWTEYNPPTNVFLTSITYGNGKFVAVGDGEGGFPENTVITSTDGINWTLSVTSGVYGLRKIAYGNGKYVAVSSLVSGGNNKIFYSSDGLTWNNQTFIFNNETILFANNKFTVGNAYSSDGINWTAATYTGTFEPNGLAYANGIYVGVGIFQSGAEVYSIAISTDAINWTFIEGPDIGAWQTVTFGDNKFISLKISFDDNLMISYVGDILRTFFSGYISPDFITSPYSSGKKLFSFTAIDGLKGLDSIRSNYASWPSPRTAAIQALVGALNQSFIEQRKVYIGCNVYETRMSDDSSVFEQFNIPANAIYTDGEDAKFTNGVRIANEQLYLSETIERLVNPFLCKVFLWENEFYVIRIDEYNKPQFRVFKFNPDATSALTPGSELFFYDLNNLDCGLNMPEQTAHRAFTEFNSYLNFGVLDKDSQGGVFDAKFEAAEWYLNSPVSPYPNTYQLLLWDYVRAIPSNQPTSVPTGSTALVQYVSNAGSEYCQIWTTTTTAGTSDPNISYIMASSSSTGGDIVVAQETANTISLGFEYMVERVSSSYSVTPATGTHAVGLMVKIGDSYLYRDTTTTFDWTATPTVMEFAVTTGSVWNTIAINNVLVPEDGGVEIRLYQLICKSGTANRYVIRYENLSLKIEKTDGLALSKIGVKAVTDLPYSNVHPDYNTYIGDAITSNSVSAIQLISANNEVSELWSRDGIEELPLLELLSQDLANLKGRPNLRILTKFRRDYVFNPTAGLGILSRNWLPISYELDCRSGYATIEFYDLGEITT